MEVFSGYWNGEPAKFRVVTITIGPEPEELKRSIERHNQEKRFLWFDPFIGKQWQAVEVHQDGQVFYLDNETGLGLRKVTEGMGSPRVSHWSIYPDEKVPIIPVHKSDWIKWFPALVNKIQEDIDIAWRKIDADGYNANKEKVEALRRSIEKMKNS